MARLGHPIHDFVLDRATLSAQNSLLDLGCGTGPGLATAHTRAPGVALIGMDAREQNIAAARALLERLDAEADLRVVDLDGTVPLDDNTVGVVICHNVLECLADPVALMNEAHRVLAPAGIAVWSHTDFDTIVVNTSDDTLERNRRVLHAYADKPQPWMNHSDARMGRKLPGLVQRSCLDLVAVDAHVVCATEPTPEVQDRLDDINRSLTGSPLIDPDDLHRWQADLRRSIDNGTFFFAETSFVVSARKP